MSLTAPLLPSTESPVVGPCDRDEYFRALEACAFRDPGPSADLLRSLRRVVQSRYLLSQFIRREVSIRYKQTMLGFGWAIFQPLTAMVMFAVVFGKFLGVDSEGAPYLAFVMCGLVPWTFFSSGLLNGSQAVVSASGLIGKVPFPPELLPIAGVSAAAVDFAIAAILLFLLLIGYGLPITFWYLLLPMLIALQFLFTLGLAFFFAALNVQYRDVRYVLPFLLPLLMYAMPIGYSLNVIPNDWYWPVVLLNPMAGFIDAYRKVLLAGSAPDWPLLIVAAVQTLLLAVVAYKFFKHRERAFADVI